LSGKWRPKKEVFPDEQTRYQNLLKNCAKRTRLGPGKRLADTIGYCRMIRQDKGKRRRSHHTGNWVDRKNQERKTKTVKVTRKREQKGKSKGKGGEYFAMTGETRE